MAQRESGAKRELTESPVAAGLPIASIRSRRAHANHLPDPKQKESEYSTETYIQAYARERSMKTEQETYSRRVRSAIAAGEI